MDHENWFARLFKSKLGNAIYTVVFVSGMIALVLWLGGCFKAMTHSQKNLTKAELSNIPRFQVAGVSVRGFNISDFRVTGLWEFKFSVQSPYQFNFFYTNIESSLLYMGVNLTSTSDTKPFAQPAEKSEMPMYVTFMVDLPVIKGQRAINDLVIAKNSSVVYFSVKIGLDYILKNGYEGRNYYGFVDVFCENVKVGFPLSSSGMGRLLHDSRDCKVY